MRRAALLALLLIACRNAVSSAQAQPAPAYPSDLRVAERIWDAEAGLAKGWNDYGWAPREFGAGKPAEVDFANYGGWILAHPDLRGSFGGVTFRMKAPPQWGDFLEVRIDSSGPEVFPRLSPKPGNARALEGGWVEYFFPMAELNPRHVLFEQVILRARKRVSGPRAQIDRVALTAAPEQHGDAQAREVGMQIDCLLPTHPISPMVYGIALNFQKEGRDTAQWELGAGARRWGGNSSTRYNWQNGHAWNTANDWFFRNVNYTGDPTFSWDRFLETDLAHHMKTALTLPTLGWVAKDDEAVSFPVRTFGAQQRTAPEDPNAGNGVSRDGRPIAPGPPERTSVPSTPETIAAWVRAIREKDKTRGRSVDLYLLDNEPMLWNSTHRDVHPKPVTYDELLDKVVSYGEAVRAADPQATIGGPSAWGWPSLFYSAADADAGFQLRPDRLAHGNVPLLPWLLRKVHAREKQTGVKILDVVDVHFYPAAKVGVGTEGGTDLGSAGKRIRSTRALWDATYRDESWIDEPVRLIPRLREWIADNDPGLGIVIGEYNFGAERHMSGGLAVAEALGRFGALGIAGAFYWTYPPRESPAYWAFRAFRNYDGEGARFGDESLQARSLDPGASLFASRDGSGTVTAVLLNLDPAEAVNARIDVSSCRDLVVKRAFSYAGDKRGLSPSPIEPELPKKRIGKLLPPWSMTVLELRPRS